MKVAFSAIVFIHLDFCLQKPHHKMPKRSALQSSSFSLWMQWMLYRSISIQSPTPSRLSGPQVHAEQINVNPTAPFPWVLIFQRIIKVKKRNHIPAFLQNQQQFRASIRVFVNLRSLQLYFYHLNQKCQHYNNFFKCGKKNQCLPHRGKKYQVFISL